MKPIQCSLLFFIENMKSSKSEMLQPYDDLNKTFNIEYSN